MEEVRPVKVEKTISTHDDEINIVVTVPSDVDLDEYTDYLAKDLVKFLNKELYSQEIDR